VVGEPGETRYDLAIAERDHGARIAAEVERTGDRRPEQESRPRFMQIPFHVRSARAGTSRPQRTMTPAATE
jgi:hypothetical protein